MKKSKIAIMAAIPLAFVALSSLLLFTQFDNKIFDLFQRVMPPLKESPEALIISIDDQSLNKVGVFPWPRDIVADSIVLLRELGAESAVFDLSYLDKSPRQVNSEVIKTELPLALDGAFGLVNAGIANTMDAFATGAAGKKEAPALKEIMLSNSEMAKQSLSESIGFISRDMDEYFARTLRFFGSSYLTLTMSSQKDLVKGETVDMGGVDIPWVVKHISLKNINIIKDTKSPRQVGFQPAIRQLITSSAGAGFVNLPPDADGYMRRVHLLNEYAGAWYGQLALVPLLKRLGDPRLTVTDATITLNDAVLEGNKTDIVIPRAQDGSILLKWPKKKLLDYNQLSMWDLAGANRVETELMFNIGEMQKSGFYSFWTKEKTPTDHFAEAQYLREMLYGGEAPADGITMDAYREYRQAFIDSLAEFLSSDYRDKIIASLDPADTSTSASVKSIFETCQNQYAQLLTFRQRVRDKVDGAMCIIGVNATSMTDVGNTTYQKRFANVGVYPVLVNMILSRDFLDDASPWISIIIAVIVCLAMAFILRRLESTKALIAGSLTLVILIALDLLFFRATRIYVGLMIPWTAAASYFLSQSVYGFLKTLREKSFLRSAFSRYLSPAVINEIIADPSKLNLGGEKRVMTAIFTDIRGFSTISENMDAAELVKLLNMYLTEMSNIIMANRGTIDKYEGDAIIAFFGAPIYMEDHAFLACKTAIQMKKAETVLNQKVKGANLSPSPLFTRLGINSGEMVVGNMGTPTKMDYTVMGNSVNLAARLEGVNKQYNTGGILISEDTRKRLGDEFALRRLDRVRVVGVQTPMRLFELIDMKADAPEELLDTLNRWESAVDLYETREFLKAADIFSEVLAAYPHDGVAQFYSERCLQYLQNPPEADWDSVATLTQK